MLPSRPRTRKPSPTSTATASAVVATMRCASPPSTTPIWPPSALNAAIRPPLRAPAQTTPDRSVMIWSLSQSKFTGVVPSSASSVMPKSWSDDGPTASTRSPTAPTGRSPVSSIANRAPSAAERPTIRPFSSPTIVQFDRTAGTNAPPGSEPAGGWFGSAPGPSGSEPSGLWSADVVGASGSVDETSADSRPASSSATGSSAPPSPCTTSTPSARIAATTTTIGTSRRSRSGAGLPATARGAGVAAVAAVRAVAGPVDGCDRRCPCRRVGRGRSWRIVGAADSPPSTMPGSAVSCEPGDGHERRSGSHIERSASRTWRVAGHAGVRAQPGLISAPPSTTTVWPVIQLDSATRGTGRRVAMSAVRRDASAASASRSLPRSAPTGRGPCRS